MLARKWTSQPDECVPNISVSYHLTKPLGNDWTLNALVVDFVAVVAMVSLAFAVIAAHELYWLVWTQ